MARAEGLGSHARQWRWLGPRFWLDWLAVGDPDLSLFRAGARPAVAVALTTALLALFARFAHLPLAGLVPGVVVSMIASIQANDAPPERQRPIIAWLVVPTSLGLALGTMLAPHGVLGQVGLVAVTFLAIFVRHDGPRGLAFGQLGFLGYFFALFFQASLSALPPLLLSVGVGVGVAYLARFGLVPDNDRTSLRWSLRRMPVALGMLLGTLADGLQHPGGWGGRQEIALREARRRVNRVAIAIDDHLTEAAALAIAPGLTASELRERIFELELALDYVASRARVLASGSPDPHGVRLERLVEPPRGAPDDLPTRLDAIHSLLEARRLLRQPEGEPQATPPPELAASLVALIEAERRLCLPGTPGRVSPLALEAPLPDLAQPAGLALPTRQAIQASLAVALSILAGQALSPSRWTWAAIGAYIMFIRATTLGETLARGWHRITGTLAGVGAGIVVASLVTGHEGLELTVVGLAIFLGFYLVKIFYAGLVFGITLALAVLYVMLGSYSPALMVLRLEETLVGCVLGGLVAALVLPAPTRQKVDVLLARLLRELAALLEEAEASELVRTPLMLEHSRDLDRTMQALREAAKPLSIGLLGLTIRDGSERVHLADRVVLCGRHLTGSLEDEGFDGEARARLGAGLGGAIARARALASRLEGPPAPEPDSSRPSVPGSSRTPLYWLARLEDALSGLESAVGR